MKRSSSNKTHPVVSYPPPRPTLLCEERGGLGHAFDIIPEDRNYNFEDIYHGRSGDSAILTPGNHSLQHTEHLFAKVENLEAAKRKATGSFSKLCSTTDTNAIPSLAAAATRDQQDVLRHRVDVLNKLLSGPDSHICVHHALLSNPTKPRTLCAVTYTRFVRESVGSDKEVGEIQSPMAWFVPGAQQHVVNLLSGQKEVPMQTSLAGLLYGLRKCTPARYCTKKLLKSLVPKFPDELREITDFHKPKIHGHTQPSAITSHHTRVYEAVAELRPSKKKPEGKPESVTFRIIMGVLDLNVLEQWQNPATNALVRKSIIATAMQHPHAQMTTVHNLHVKITRGRETHVLTFRPFIGDEACTVSHLTYTESAMDDGMHGILRLPEDTADVHALHGGTMLPIESYVCIGAHRESRYNEAQLNYIHSQGYRGTPVIGSTLPDPRTIRWDAPDAKATRISGKDTDVMASSYRIHDKVHTVLTVISYPPFGTQFKVHIRKNKKEKAEARQKRMEALKKRGIKPRVLFKKEIMKADLTKKERWSTAPDHAQGQYYFVEGVVSNTCGRQERIYLIDTDGGARTQRAMQEGVRIRDDLIKECAYGGGTIWNPDISFKENLQTNTAVHPISQRMVKDIWQDKWRRAIAEQIQDGALWFCKQRGVWPTTLALAGLPRDVCEKYEARSIALIQSAMQKGQIPMKFVTENGLQSLLPAQIIPRRVPPPPSKEMHVLQDRIRTLEAKLHGEGQAGNLAVLMDRVLSSLRHAN
jgi:hypothetical protein